MHAYLEEKYANIVASYNESIENDIVNVKNNIDRLGVELLSNREYVKKVQLIRE